MEKIDRGVVAIHEGDGKVFVSWRLLATDAPDTAFNLYRTAAGAAPLKINDKPLAGPTFFIDEKAACVDHLERPPARRGERTADIAASRG